MSTLREQVEELRKYCGDLDRYGGDFNNRLSALIKDAIISIESLSRKLELAIEKQMQKKPKEYEDKYYACPTCGNVLMHKWKKYPELLYDKSNGMPYCLGCGQAIDWEED